MRRLVSLSVLLSSLWSFSTATTTLEAAVSAECSHTWTAELISQSNVEGQAAVLVKSRASLGIRVSVQGGHGIHLAELVVHPELPGDGRLTFALTPCSGPGCAEPWELQVTHETVQAIQLAAVQGKVMVVVSVVSDLNMRLHGALLPDCTLPQAAITRQRYLKERDLDALTFLQGMEAQRDDDDASIFCPLPQASKVYTIPEGCHGIQERLQAHCGLSPQSVALASGFLFSANSQPSAGFGVGYSMCIPEDCNPCEVDLEETSASLIPWPVYNAFGAQQRCPIPGLDTEYIVPPGCDHFAEQAQALCGLDLGDLFSPDYVADPNLLGPWDSVCLPQGCEPCRSGLAKLADLELQGGLQKVPVQASVGAGEAELGDKGASSSWLTSIINGVRVWTRG